MGTGLWKEEDKKVVVLDASVLLAAGWQEKVNQVWVSIVDRKEAVRRIVERDGKTEEEAVKRLESQMSNQEFVDSANVVFCSKWEKQFTQAQVKKAWDHVTATYLDNWNEIMNIKNRSLFNSTGFLRRFNGLNLSLGAI